MHACRGRAWPIHRPSPAVRMRWLPAGVELPLPRRLRRPGEEQHRDDMPPPRLQDQIPGQLLPPPGQPRMRLHQPHLRLLRRVQAPVQRPALEDVHRLLQLPPRGRRHRRQDPMHARRALAGVGELGPDQGDREAGGCAGPRPALRPSMGRSRPGRQRLGRER